MREVALLDIKTDYIFKLVFGAEKNKDVLISFLNAVFKGHPHVEDIQLKNTEIPKILKNNSSVRLDIKADIGGQQFVDIEIQVRNTGEIIERSVQYLANMMAENFNVKSKKDADAEEKIDETRSYKFPKVIGIWILATNITDRKAAVNEALLTFQPNQMDDYAIATDKMRLFTIELPKFNPKKLDRKNMLDFWMAFLKDPRNEEASQIQEISKALDTLQEVSEDDEIREIYELRRKTEDGIISEMTVKTIEAEKKGRKEGRIEGRKEGRIEGRKEGRKEEKIEIAKMLLKMGDPVEKITIVTGLSAEEIENLKP